MALPRKTKWILGLIPVALLLLFALYEGGRFWWYRGYSRGSRTGVVRKVSVSGPPYCKFFSGELAVPGVNPLAPEIWMFSVDDDSDTNPVVVQLHDAEKSGMPVTLQYRRDLHALFRCSPSEYFVTKIEK